ncbi:MAG: MFS transporter [bacterium]|nr:MFS transporter [bacterium]
MNKQSTMNMRTFYTLILTQTFSLIGSRISGLAIGIWIFKQTGEATPLALVSFFAMLPQVLASGLSGVLADRWNRRYAMIIGDAGQAVGTLLLFFSFATDSFELWHLYVVTFMGAIFAVFQGPAFQASVTLLVPDDHRDRANAIQQLTGPVAGIIAPALAGMVYALVNVEGAIILDLLTFVAAMVVVFYVHIPQPPRTSAGEASRGSLWKEMMAGVQYLVRNNALLILILGATAINFLFTAAMALSTPYLLARTGSETQFGIILSVMNLGAIVGGVTFGMLKFKHRRIYNVIFGIGLSGLFLAGIGFGQTAIMLGLFAILMMLPLPMVNASLMSILQGKVPPDLQGRVFALMGQIALLLSPVSLLLVGPLADRVAEPAVRTAGWSLVAPFVGAEAGAGMGLIYVGAGLLAAGVALMLYFVPAVRQVETLLPDYVATGEMPVVPSASDDLAAGLDGQAAPLPAN